MEAQVPVTRDFRLHLQDELVKRCHRNPKYSLRAFAKNLGIGSSALSDILNSKRSLTEAMKHRLGFALGLSAEELSQFKSNQKRPVRPNASLATAKLDREEFQQITIDTFAIISDWHHYAILELVRVKGFKPDARWIARSLGLTQSEVNIAVDRLQRVGLLDVSNRGKWIDQSAKGKATSISPDFTSAAAKKHQKQVLEKSIQAVNEVPIHLRNHTSITFAMNPEDIPNAVKQIKAFRRRLGIQLEKNRNPTQVYQLSISLFPVTNIKEDDHG